jgi:hypothetical protein
MHTHLQRHVLQYQHILQYRVLTSQKIILVEVVVTRLHKQFKQSCTYSNQMNTTYYSPKFVVNARLSFEVSCHNILTVPYEVHTTVIIVFSTNSVDPNLYIFLQKNFFMTLLPLFNFVKDTKKFILHVKYINSVFILCSNCYHHSIHFIC